MVDSGIIGKVVLRAFDSGGSLVAEETVGVDEYYDDVSPLIDDDQYRRNLGVVLILGKLYDWDGNLGQDMEMHYDANGDCCRIRAVHADGTVTENEN